MNKLTHPVNLPFWTLLAGGVGLLLRIWLMTSGVDQSGFVVTSHFAAIALFLLALAVVIAVFFLTRSLVEATNFVKTVEKHQHRKIACLEEIAYLNGWISKEEVLGVYENLNGNQYGQYLKDVVDGKYQDGLY